MKHGRQGRPSRRLRWLPQDLEPLTFADEQLNLVVTEEVFEHILHPELAFQEAHRVLKSYGHHV